MKYNKAKALLSLRGMDLTDYAEYMGISKQQISNKKKTDTFRVDEFIKLAELTGTTLAFNDNETGKPLIQLDSTDLKGNE